MNVRSSRASQVDGQGFEIFNTRYYGKSVQVSLVWSLAAVESSMPPHRAVSHMLYIDGVSVVAGDVAQALDIAAPGDCVVVLCANRQVSLQVRDVLQPQG